MVTFPQIDNVIDARMPEMVQVQEQFFLLHGRYAQLGRTHHAVPSVDVPMPADAAGERISSEPASWIDLGQLPAELHGCHEIENYCGPHGHGWVLISRTIKEGVRYVRRINRGPEVHRDHDWKVEEME